MVNPDDSNIKFNDDDALAESLNADTYSVHNLSLNLYKQNAFATQEKYPDPFSPFPVYDMKIASKDKNIKKKRNLATDTGFDFLGKYYFKIDETKISKENINNSSLVCIQKDVNSSYWPTNSCFNRQLKNE